MKFGVDELLTSMAIFGDGANPKSKVGIVTSKRAGDGKVTAAESRGWSSF